jgi:gamma-carbonic anhydrase
VSPRLVSLWGVCYFRLLFRAARFSAVPAQFRGSVLIRSYRGRMPQIAATAYVDPQAVVIGDVTIGEDSSVWPLTVVRGDVHYIRIGARTNIQDSSVLHVMRETHPLILGDDVTVGHKVILHGCTIESRCLVGMGCIVLNGVRIGTGSIIAAGTLVAEGTEVPPGSLFMGHPGRLRRTLSEEEQATIDRYAQNYVEYKDTYKAG